MEDLDLKISTMKELNDFLYSCSKTLSVVNDMQRKLFKELNINVQELSPFGYSIEWEQISNRNDVREGMRKIGEERDLLLLNQIKLFKEGAPKRQEKTERRKSFLRGGIKSLEDQLTHCEQTEESRFEILNKIEKVKTELKSLE